MPKIWCNEPPEKVFPIISDLKRHAEWAQHKIEIEAANEGPVKVGSKYTSKHEKSKVPDEVSVTELVPNERFVFRSIMPKKFEMDFVMTVKPKDGGSEISRDAKVRKAYGFNKLLLPLIWLMGPRFEKKNLKSMKRVVEAAAK